MPPAVPEMGHTVGMTEAERPKSSWQSWVRSAERGRRDPGPTTETGDLDVELAWGSPSSADAGPVWDDARAGSIGALSSDASAPDPAAGWITDGAADDVVGADDLLEAEEAWLDDDLDVEADDGTGAFGGGGAAVEAEDDDDPEDGEFGELLPSVPLLPSIAGRVEALGGVLRSIAHRVDGLNAATDVYRSTVVDRIDEFTETVLEQGRRADASLDEYRRTTERTIAELRRRIGEQGELASRLLARVEEVATDVSSLVGAGGAAAGGPATTRRPAAGDPALPDLVAAQQATDRALGHIRELLEIVVDTMPASAEGSGVDLGAAIAGVQAAVDRLGTAAAPPAATIDAAAIGDLADAVVARLDLDALATLVAEHLADGFEVVPDPAGADEAPPAEPAPVAAPPKGRSRRR